MRKAITMSLVATFVAAAIGGSAMAADRAGIGFEFGMGPTIVLGGEFNMEMTSAGAFTWNVSDNFAVSIFSGNGKVRGEHSYTDNTGANNVDRKIAVSGEADTRGLGIWASLPMLSFIKVGFELGTVQLSEQTVQYSESDGSNTTGLADFGGVRDALNDETMMEGIAGRITFIRGDSKTVTADLSVVGSLRFVQTNQDLRIYGIQESDSTTLPLKAIDPISSWNHLDLKIAATIGF